MTDLKTVDSYIATHARPVDYARWRYHFAQGSKEAVMDALAAYQNADGGFGHGLEPDCWNPHSSPVQTWTAASIIREIGWTDPNHPVIRGMVRYLSSGADFKDHLWASNCAENALYPHAPWWELPESGEQSYSCMPSASLAGFLARFAQGTISSRLGVKCAKAAYDWIMSAQDPIDMHTLNCFVELLEDAESSRNGLELDVPRLRQRVLTAVEKCVCRDVSRWQNEYVCKPSLLIHGKNSILKPMLDDLIRKECDMLRSTALEDGSWPVTWQWSGYPEEWAVTKVWWKASLAVSNLVYLRDHGT